MPPKMSYKFDKQLTIFYRESSVECIFRNFFLLRGCLQINCWDIWCTPHWPLTSITYHIERAHWTPSGGNVLFPVKMLLTRMQQCMDSLEKQLTPKQGHDDGRFGIYTVFKNWDDRESFWTITIMAELVKNGWIMIYEVYAEPPVFPIRPCLMILPTQEEEQGWRVEWMMPQQASDRRGSNHYLHHARSTSSNCTLHIVCTIENGYM